MATLSLGGLLAQRSAFAQAHDPAAAEALFDEGRALIKEGRYAEACRKLEASERLDPATGTLLNLGDCYAKIGRTASAWLAFREAAASASREGQRSRATVANARAQELEPRLCRLRIVVVDPGTKATVLRDGVPFDSSTWGEALPVDPGHHSVSAQEDNTVVFLEDLEIASTSGGSCPTRTVTVRAAVTPTASAVAPAPAPSAPSAGPKVPPVASSLAQGARSPIPLAVAGLGLVGVGVGTYVGLHAKSEWDDARGMCVPAGCGSDAQSLASSARRDADIASVTLIGGTALAAAGVLWWLFVTPSSKIDAQVGATANGVIVRGRFE